MPDSTNNIWIDSTFYEPTDGDTDLVVRYTTVAADNIGSHLTPVIYSPVASVYNHVNIGSFATFQTISGSNINNTAVGYFTTSGTMTGVNNLQSSLLLYPISSSGIMSTNMIYFTGYTAIPGSINTTENYIAGNEYNAMSSTPSYFLSPYSVSGIKNFVTNYTDYTGSTQIDGTPIPSYSGFGNVNSVYDNIFDSYNSSCVNKIIDISFAGWVDFTFSTDIYSADEAHSGAITTYISSIDGKVSHVDVDSYSCSLMNKAHVASLYSTIQQGVNIPYDAITISGSVHSFDCTTCTSSELDKSLKFNVDLLSLKISNFSIGVGDFITASGIIYVDVTDDEYQVSIDHTYLEIDGVVVPIVMMPITDGYRLLYDPTSNFVSMTGPSVFTVNATNTNGITIRDDFYVTFGYVVEYNNNKGFTEAIDYGFDNRVAVRISIEDYSSCPTQSTVAWEFDSKGMFNNDIGASINGRLYGLEQSNMPASIYPLSTAYFYGKEVRVVLNAKDFAGNDMEPLVLTYKIENKPQ